MMRWLGFTLALLPLGCVKAPDIVVVDRATALEQQAAGPEALTPDELEALGIKPEPIVDHTEQTEADRVDALLRQHCIGEGNGGLLVDTHDDCIGATDRATAITLVDRTNRARLQLWHWLAAEQPDRDAGSVRTQWRAAHSSGVVCRGWVQADDGTWAAKKC
jgi:hypothetical protein